jgi:hypothetical protein
MRLGRWVVSLLLALLLAALLTAHVAQSAKHPAISGTPVYRIGRSCPSSLPLPKWIGRVPLWERVDFGPGIVGYLGGPSDQQAVIWTSADWRYQEIGFEVAASPLGPPWTASDGNLPGSGVWSLTLTKQGYTFRAAWVVNGACRSFSGPTSPEAQEAIAAVIRAASAQPDVTEFRLQCHFTAANLSCSAVPGR